MFRYFLLLLAIGCGLPTSFGPLSDHQAAVDRALIRLAPDALGDNVIGTWSVNSIDISATSSVPVTARVTSKQVRLADGSMTTVIKDPDVRVEIAETPDVTKVHAFSERMPFLFSVEYRATVVGPDGTVFQGPPVERRYCIRD